MTRHIRELPEYQFEIFDKIVSEGFSGDVAYPIAFNTAAGRIGRNIPVTVYPAIHRAWPTFSLEQFKRFLQGDFTGLEASSTHFRVGTGLYGGAKILGCPTSNPAPSESFWANLWDSSDFPEYREELKKYRRELAGEKMYTPPNPFNRASPPVGPRNVFDVTIEEIISFVLPWMKKKGLLDV
jgi:hypothetical protein